MARPIRLPVAAAERRTFRSRRIAIASLATMAPRDLAAATGMPLPRATLPCAQASFQTLASAGPAAARDLWDAGMRGLGDLKDADPARMYARLVRAAGGEKRWWRYTDQRGSGAVRWPEK